MSQVAISGNASGTGTLTIAAPNTNSNFTLTLPQNTGTFITTSSTGQVIPRAALPTGSVLQVVNAVSTTTTTTTSQTPQSTSLAASITPSSNTSKILVLVAPIVYVASTGSDAGCGFYIYRGATQVYADSNVYDSFYTGTTNGVLRGRMNLQYLDSPASTSSLTYTFYISAYNGTVSLSAQNSKAQITLMEIAA